MDEKIYKKISDGWYNGFDVKTRNSVGAKINRAIKSGTLEKPSRCLVCGLQRGIIMAHLEDYNNWRQYFPMCFVCHSTLHGRYKRPEIFYKYIEWIKEKNQPIPFTRYDWKRYQDIYCKKEFRVFSRLGAGDTTFLEMLDMDYTDFVPEKFLNKSEIFYFQHHGKTPNSLPSSD